MNIIYAQDYNDMSFKAAEIVLDEIRRNPSAVISLPTGSTPIGLYSCLVNAYKMNKADFSRITTFNLDEYYPMKKDDKNSYYHFMHKNLFDNINIKPENINLLDGEAENASKECKRYDLKFMESRVNLQILGLGSNGHIGFNEPGTSFESTTRVISLSEDTRKANSRLFASIDEVPKSAMTLGIKNILSSRKILLLISGMNKTKAAKDMLEHEISENFPATILRKHDDVTVIIDKSQVKI